MIKVDAIPLVSVEGTSFECGGQLGYMWRDSLTVMAQKKRDGARPWWYGGKEPFTSLLKDYVPHLPDVYRGMARGSGLRDDQVGSSVPMDDGGCTSFAVHPFLTSARHPISGQTKDTDSNRRLKYIVLRFAPTDAPHALTVTYPGWLFGHGFVRGRCAVWRNALNAGVSKKGKIPYAVWGIVALHCSVVEEVKEETGRWGVARENGHCTVADSHGGILGVEMGEAGMYFCRSLDDGVYVHANKPWHRVSAECMTGSVMQNVMQANSAHRETQLRANILKHKGLTAPLIWSALVDHTNYPNSVCQHNAPDLETSAAIVAEPTRGLIHVSRGAPCENWPVTYSL